MFALPPSDILQIIITEYAMKSGRATFVFILTLFFPAILLAQRTIPIRIATYDIRSFSGESQAQNLDVARILRHIGPSIVVVEGMTGGGAIVLNTLPGISDLKTPQTSPYPTAALYYNDRVVECLYLRTSPDVNEWVMRVIWTDDTIHILRGYFKPGDDPNSRDARAQMATQLRRYIEQVPKGHHFVVLGPINVYHSDEPAYFVLTQEIRTGPPVHDPLGRPGLWHHNQAFADIHTASTRMRPFGGGEGGGLNDRFDFILCSQSLIDDAYVPGSYTTFGNDAMHFNDSINSRPNVAVPDSIADALHAASDHLPVYADFRFSSNIASVAGAADREGLAVSPTLIEGGEHVLFRMRMERASTVAMKLYNALGQKVAELPEREMHGGESEAVLDIASLPNGRYYYMVTAGGYRKSGTLDRVR